MDEAGAIRKLAEDFAEVLGRAAKDFAGVLESAAKTLEDREAQLAKERQQLEAQLARERQQLEDQLLKERQQAQLARERQKLEDQLVREQRQLEGASHACEDRDGQLAGDRRQLAAQLLKERQQAAKQTSASFDGRPVDELVEINVGGEVMTTARDTLLLAEGTFLEAIFSGRWEGSVKRDGNGRIFLDCSPLPFRAVLSYLRARRDAEVEDCVPAPVAPPGYEAEFKAMVRFLGLAAFFVHGQSCRAEALDCRQSTGGTQDGSITVEGNVIRSSANGDPRCALGQATLLGSRWHPAKPAWKVAVRSLLAGGWFAAGIVGDDSPTDQSYGHPSCCAWAVDGHVFQGGEGTLGAGGWQSWTRGDVAVFELDPAARLLRLFHRRTNGVYTLHVAGDCAQVRVHFNFAAVGTEIQVSQATAEDLAEAGF